MLVAIAAIAANRTMGKDGAIPWHGYMSADLNRFRELTDGKTMIMGDRTFFEFSEPLPNRLHIVVSPDKHNDTKMVKFVGSIYDAVAHDIPGKDVFIIGGASIFDQTKQLWQKIYLTRIHEEFDGDAFFPDIDYSRWEVSSEQDYKADNQNAYDYSFTNYGKPGI